jgi:hypothetical protein
VAAAAAVLLLLIPLFRGRSDGAHRAASGLPAARSEQSDRGPEPSRDHVAQTVESPGFAGVQAAPTDEPVPLHPAPERASPSLVASEAVSPDVARVRKLLDDPHLRRVFLITDRIESSLEPEVSSLVERTTRHAYFKITVAQGIVIDPKHPGKSTVFAVVLDDSQLAPFRERLRSRFSDRVAEADPDPTITVQLADIGQVISLPAHPVGDVTIPTPKNLAILEPLDGDPDAAEQPVRPDAIVASDTARQLDRPATDRVRAEPEPARAVRNQIPGEQSKTLRNGQDSVASTGAHPGVSPPVSPQESTSFSQQLGGQPARNRPSPGVNTRRCVVLVWLAEPGPT